MQGFSEMIGGKRSEGHVLIDEMGVGRHFWMGQPKVDLKDLRWESHKTKVKEGSWFFKVMMGCE